MVSDILCCVATPWRFRGYAPQLVTMARVWEWLSHFAPEDRSAVRSLLRHVSYFSESEIRRSLVALNDGLLDRLAKAGVPTHSTIYVQIGEAGSSSPVMLNMLRDAAHLERRGCIFLDSKDILTLQKTTNKLGEGAIVYVDDFVGTGNQSCEARDFVSQYIVGDFTEFMLVPCVCPEGMKRLEERGVETLTSKVHGVAERPLHADAAFWPEEYRSKLVSLCAQVEPKVRLGYDQLATMVVIYRNAPNTVPSVFRGNIGQDRYSGLFPRTTDLRRQDHPS